MGILPFLCLGLLAFEAEGMPAPVPDTTAAPHAEEITIVPKERRYFDAPQVEWLWPRVTPRFMHDFSCRTLQLHPTVAVQFAACTEHSPANPNAEPDYSWWSVRGMYGHGFEWRQLPKEGIGYLRVDIGALFVDSYTEKLAGHKQVEFLGHECHAVGYFRGGLRFANIDITSDWQSSIFPRRTDDEYWGIGLVLGGHAIFSPGDGRLQLFLDEEFSCLFGAVEKEHRGQITLGSGTLTEIADSTWNSRALVGVRARTGVHWHEDIGRYRLRFSLGYQGEIFGHIGDEVDAGAIRYRNGVPISLEPEMKVLTDLLSHGPFMQCEIRY